MTRKEVDDLYVELRYFREKIKEKIKRETGKVPVVCSDEALLNMANTPPSTIEEFHSIHGIGDTFVEKYGNWFLQFLSEYFRKTNTNSKTIKLSKDMVFTLKELEKKLVNINKRNRLLYMPKMTAKTAADISNTHNLINFIFGRTKRIDVAQGLLTINPQTGEVVEEIKDEAYRKLKPIIRENDATIREKGQNFLYVAYPFVVGKFAEDDFDVRAPLALFPVKQLSESTTISIVPDDTRSIVYNTTLLLAKEKLSGINKEIPDSEIIDINKETFIDSLVAFYKENGINIVCKDGESVPKVPEPFINYLSGEFPKYANGEFHIEHNAIIGRFNIVDNAIQQDFEKIIQLNEINEHLDELLSVDISDESQSNDKSEIGLSNTEKEIIYINNLDASQEKVLHEMKNRKSLVIQGPPGTGKSQVISSLIADSVCNKKTVLMVSEKKTALDVVYSRLGHLSTRALLIDDANNKTSFYTQMYNIMNSTDALPSPISEIERISKEIDLEIEKLEKIAETIYKENPKHKASLYQLYNATTKLDINDEHELKVFEHMPKQIIPSIGCELEPLMEMQKLFSNQTLTNDMEWCYLKQKQYPWLNQLSTTMTEMEILDMVNQFKSFHASGEEIKKKNFVVKLFKKTRLKSDIKKYINSFFKEPVKDIYELYEEKFEEFIIGLSVFTRYSQCKETYQNLSKQQQYYATMIASTAEKVDISNIEINNIIYKIIVNQWISDFETHNKMTIQNIGAFDSIRQKIDQLRDKKKELSIIHTFAKISAETKELKQTKRYKEMLRAVESKRKWAISKFVKKFSLELFNNVPIWLLTPDVVSEILPLTKNLFDIVIFDEASQMYIERGIPSILRGKQVVVAGDHKQLRPSSLGSGRIEYTEEDEDDEESVTYAALEEESLLDLARFRYDDVMLNYHYRSKYEELIAFSNHAFYHGNLFISPNVEVPDKPPIEVHHVQNAMWRKRNNIEEAKYIINLLKKFFNTRKHQETVGVITFNTNQRDLINDLIDNECIKDPRFAEIIKREKIRTKNGEDIGFFVKNIENVQGDERDCIIFSIGYAKNENGRLVHRFGWLNQAGGENRLNVAISRAKRKIHIVTSFHPSELDVSKTVNDGPKIFKKYLEYAHAISNGNNEEAKAILLSFGDTLAVKGNVQFDSPFEEQVYDALIEKGYEVHSQVGVGGYNIDLAIKKGEDYILGIECDGALYHSSAGAKERDYHRQKYLETRGWQIHRIWSSNWWREPKEEIEKICKIVESKKCQK